MIMSYSIGQGASEFKVSAKNAKGALVVLKAAVEKRNFAWVSKNEVLKATNLDDALHAFGWSFLYTSPEGDYEGIECNNEKLGDEDALFAMLAPFVEANGYIEMSGEDFDRWRWVFDGMTCETQYAETTWV